MVEFTQLTPRGQAGRLRHMADAALTHYDLEVQRIRLVANHLNTIFRLDTPGGERYILRISHPTWRTDDDMRAELLWLAALARDTDLGAPIPQPTRHGELMITVAVAGVPQPRRCAVFSWLPGRDLIHDLSAANLSRLGLLAARLHAHAAQFTLPSGLACHQMDRIYAREEPDVLFAPEQAGIFTPESRRVFLQTAARVEATFAGLYADPRGRRLIHNDLHQENVKVDHGRLRPLDFEDTLWGYPVQDIAMTFADLLFYTPLTTTEYQAARAAFQRGYTAHGPWPETAAGQIDTFIAGRQLWRANYVARFEAPHARRFTTWLASRFQAFLATGVLLKEA